MNRLCLATAVTLFASPPAFAQSLPITGTWGDEIGCKVEAQGVAFTDEYSILKADAFRRHESYCEFLDIKTSKGGEHVVRSICGGEGETWLSDFVAVVNAEEKTVTLHAGAGGEPHVVRPCG